jgi:hypothetical protein
LSKTVQGEANSLATTNLLLHDVDDGLVVALRQLKHVQLAALHTATDRQTQVTGVRTAEPEPAPTSSLLLSSTAFTSK